MGRTHASVFAVIVCLAVAVVAGMMLPTGTASQAGPAPPAAAASGDYVGSEQCAQCHQEQAASIGKTVIGKVLLQHPRTPLEKRGCEACHGPGKAHIADVTNPATRGPFGKKTKATARQQNAQCVQCHEKGEHLFWRGSAHELRGLACTQCHTMHAAVSPRYQLTKKTEPEVCSQCHVVKKAQLLRTSHMPVRESKLTCGDCHNPHGSVTRKLIRQNSVNENCYKCHAEKRGPFVWEHAPVRENCLNCHEPHGSIHDKLLKVKRERLCQQCHIPSRHPTQPHDPRTRFVFNRSCLNCHPMIHGSNHPSGEYFLR
jgi:DmsE family decaheme c-type cytochrome